MARGPSPRNARFWTAPPFGPSLYVAELTNGVVKIGHTTAPRTRLASLNSECEREMDTEVARFYVGPQLNTAIGARRLETELIAICARIGEQVPGRLEFFNRIGFEIACEITALLCRHVGREQERPAQITRTVAVQPA